MKRLPCCFGLLFLFPILSPAQEATAVIAHVSAKSNEFLVNATTENTIQKTDSPKPVVLNSLGKSTKMGFLMMSGGVDSFVLYCEYGFQEHNPLARPFVHLPTPAYYATGLAIATDVNWLSWRMARSRRFRKVWFLPQMTSMAGNAWGFQSSNH